MLEAASVPDKHSWKRKKEASASFTAAEANGLLSAE